MKDSKRKKSNFSVPDCRRFTGYKPCEPYRLCPCDSPIPIGHRILIVNLDFIGDVIMTTAMLPAVKRKYQVSIVHWITKRNAAAVLENNPYLDKVWEWNDENRMILSSMVFDSVLNADKNQNSGAFAAGLNAREKFGFGIDQNGAIIPFNPEAEYNWRTGLDDHLKFKKNTRTGQEILAKTWKLDYKKDEYVLELTDEEKGYCRFYHQKLEIRNGQFVIGFNTGCSNLYPLKKMTVRHHALLIRRIKKAIPDAFILLLGGKEDEERNREIKNEVGDLAFETPVDEGLRRGILYENLCDLIVTGDSLGMHIAIALKKIVVAWFGLSCGSEIELYGRGEKILSRLDCSPCWRKECNEPRCVEELDVDRILNAVLKYARDFQRQIRDSS